MSFPTAVQARTQASDTTVVLNEIQAIESAILVAVQQGKFSNTSIGGSTTMTDSNQIVPNWPISGAPTVTGTGPFLVTYPLASTQAVAPDLSTTYVVDGSANLAYNGTFTPYASTTTSITLSYPTDPGAFVLADPLLLAASYTLAELYYRTWQGLVTDEVKAAGMQSVIANFSQLGYGIKRITNGFTNNTFLWYVTW